MKRAWAVAAMSACLGHVSGPVFADTASRGQKTPQARTSSDDTDQQKVLEKFLDDGPFAADTLESDQELLKELEEESSRNKPAKRKRAEAGPVDKLDKPSSRPAHRRAIINRSPTTESRPSDPVLPNTGAPSRSTAKKLQQHVESSQTHKDPASNPVAAPLTPINSRSQPHESAAPLSASPIIEPTQSTTAAPSAAPAAASWRAVLGPHNAAPTLSRAKQTPIENQKKRKSNSHWTQKASKSTKARHSAYQDESEESLLNTVTGGPVSLPDTDQVSKTSRRSKKRQHQKQHDLPDVTGDMLAGMLQDKSGSQLSDDDLLQDAGHDRRQRLRDAKHQRGKPTSYQRALAAAKAQTGSKNPGQRDPAILRQQSSTPQALNSEPARINKTLPTAVLASNDSRKSNTQDAVAKTSPLASPISSVSAPMNPNNPSSDNRPATARSVAELRARSSDGSVDDPPSQVVQASLKNQNFNGTIILAAIGLISAISASVLIRHFKGPRSRGVNK